ncbi:hypothetical protein GGX14DRAFT_617769 [Mycena pura]|uniref:Uncharacterized protein n=1 Tax=Mycena pura TaxID=153505 RepID=A0AAD6VIK6_9AGAR|nr:hypothetical protein GGX14DRAFT_617769 [Mycena pura]
MAARAINGLKGGMACSSFFSSLTLRIPLHANRTPQRPKMFSLIKLGAILALAAPLASALKIKEITGNFVIGGDINITWTTSNSDPAGSFTIELTHPSFNSKLAIANNVDASSLSLTNVELPVVSMPGYDFTAHIDNDAVVYAVSDSFSIGAEHTTASATVDGGVVPSTSVTPISTPSLLPSVSSSNKLASTPPSTVSVTAPASVPSGPSPGGASAGASPGGASAGGASSAASSPSPSTTGGALSVRSVSGALLVAVGAVAGALIL